MAGSFCGSCFTSLLLISVLVSGILHEPNVSLKPHNVFALAVKFAERVVVSLQNTHVTYDLILLIFFARHSVS